MHELGVTQALYDTVMRSAKEHHAEKIKEIYLVLGNRAGIEPECVDYYFRLLAENSIAEKAQLHFTPKDGTEFYIDRMEIEEAE